MTCGLLAAHLVWGRLVRVHALAHGYSLFAAAVFQKAIAILRGLVLQAAGLCRMDRGDGRPGRVADGLRVAPVAVVHRLMLHTRLLGCCLTNGDLVRIYLLDRLIRLSNHHFCGWLYALDILVPGAHAHRHPNVSHCKKSLVVHLVTALHRLRSFQDVWSMWAYCLLYATKWIGWASHDSTRVYPTNCRVRPPMVVFDTDAAAGCIHTHARNVYG